MLMALTKSFYIWASDKWLNMLTSQIVLLSVAVGFSPSVEVIVGCVVAGAHRRRSNTAQRLERLKKEKRNQCKVKTVSWKDAQTNYSGEDITSQVRAVTVKTMHGCHYLAPGLHKEIPKVEFKIFFLK